MDEKIYFDTLKKINEMIPYKECSYRNTVVATAFAKGHGSKLTTNWVKNALLSDVEDGFITYAQAVAMNLVYISVIETLKNS